MKKFLTVLFFLIMTFFTVNSANAENIKFVQVTDVHLSKDSEFSQNILRAAVKDINSQQGISFVVFTGDNISSPDEESLRVFMSIIKKLNVPYYIALGNHDVYKSKNMSKVQYFSILRNQNPFFMQKSPNYKFSKNGFVFLVVDGAKEIIPGSIGYYRSNTLAWVDKMLSKNRKKPVIIFQHFPVVYPDGVESKLKTHKTYKVEEYQNMLAKHDNVLAILSGHFHVNSENMQDGVYHISTPSLIALPYSYKVVDIVTTKDFSPIIYTQLREFEVEN